MIVRLTHPLIWLLAGGLLAGCGDAPEDRGAAGTTAAEVAAAQGTDDAAWRKCEIEGPLACKDPDQVCDMYRNECVPICSGSHCCDDVECPPGSVCVPNIGRCGVPAGEGCFDMGTAWWTGRDIRPEQARVPERATPAMFVVHNAGDEPLYFRSTLRQPARFALLQASGDETRRLDLAENHFCPTLCPAVGRPMEVDCGPEPRIVRRLLPGESLSLDWSGLEQVGMRRICDGPPGAFCYVERVTLHGVYSVEVCSYPRVAGGRADPEDPNRLLGATPAGEPSCVQVEFRYPAEALVDVVFDG